MNVQSLAENSTTFLVIGIVLFWGPKVPLSTKSSCHMRVSHSIDKSQAGMLPSLIRDRDNLLSAAGNASDEAWEQREELKVVIFQFYSREFNKLVT